MPSRTTPGIGVVRRTVTQGVSGAGRVRVLGGALASLEVFPLAGGGFIGGEPTIGFGVLARDAFGNPLPGRVVEVRIEEDRSGQVSCQ